MAKKLVLTLTEKQAEILGYALNVARRKRNEDAERSRAANRQIAAKLATEQAAQIDELTWMLDAAPVVDGNETKVAA